MKYRILAIDDDKNLRENLRCALEREDYAVFTAADGLSALDILKENDDIDLIVADIGMPRLDGLDFLKRLRAGGSCIPLIFLTSRDEEIDRVLGLELGADDYLTKPFSVRELLARIKAVLRRSKPPAAQESHGAKRILRGQLAMDPERFSAAFADRELKLTITEFRLLSALAAEPGMVKTREALLEAAYPEDSYLSDRSVDCHIKRLRRKLSDATAPETLIQTIYGLGYRYADGREEEA